MHSLVERTSCIVSALVCSASLLSTNLLEQVPCRRRIQRRWFLPEAAIKKLERKVRLPQGYRKRNSSQFRTLKSFTSRIFRNWTNIKRLQVLARVGSTLLQRRERNYYMTFSSLRHLISCSECPRKSFRISLVCWPNNGGANISDPLRAENFIGTPI